MRGFRGRPCHVVVRVNIIGKTVEQNDREPARIATFEDPILRIDV
jgi:hypothetical protein